MKKYLSCIILILACVVCAMVFYVNAQAPKPDEGSTEQIQSSPVDTNVSLPIENQKVLTIDDKGTVLSEYFCSSRLRVEWKICKYENEAPLFVSAELYLDSEKGIEKPLSGYFSINGEITNFSANPSKEKNTFLCNKTIEISDFSNECTIDFEALANINISEESGVNLDRLSLSAKVYESEATTNATSHIINIEHISQYPSLPSGDEITSLATVLKYLKYNINECDLCDLYLDKGPVGFTDFNKANIGNPRDTYNSYGCLAPVIINASEKFIKANGGGHIAYNYSGYNPDELYRQVSLDNPVIVWLCDDFGNTPSISRIWIVDGKTIYLKSNMACMVLVGYDYTKNTVTLCNPAGNIFTIDMSLFEKSYYDMGSYAVIVK